MAKLQNKTLIFSLENIVSVYAEDADINGKDDLGCYERFDCLMQVGEGENKITVLNENFELCEGNILGLSRTIDYVLSGRTKKDECEFCEPDFNFIIENLYEDAYEFQIWVDENKWSHERYGCDGLGFKFYLNKNQLQKFYYDLLNEWNLRKRNGMK